MAASDGGLRALNRSKVLASVRSGASSRADVCAHTGLARSTVTGLVGELLKDGALLDVRPDESVRAPGRPARRLTVAPPRDVVLAVDFGHRHCRVGLVEVHATSARVLAETTHLLDVDAAPGDAVELAADTAAELVRATEVAAVAGGVGVPAPVDPATGSVGTGNLLPRWVDRHPAAELADRLGVPFAIDNDANLGALAEASFGSRPTGDLVYVKASTGVGAGLLLGGRVHRGSHGRAGEIGHVPVDPTGALCRCGNRGCLETLASVDSVVAAIAPRSGGSTTSMTMADVAHAVHAGDPGAARVVGDAGRLIGRVLADLVNSLNPEHVVLGGELSAAGDPLLAGVRESVDRFAQPGLARTLTIGLSTLDALAELLGAAALAAALVRHRAGEGAEPALR